MNDLDIKPIRNPNSDFKERKLLNPTLPDIYKGALVCVVGGPKSGKGTMWNNLLHRESMYRDLFGKVYIISPTIYTDQTSHYSRLKWENTCFDQYDDSIIEKIIKHQKDLIADDNEDTSYCLILDDLCGQFSKNGGKKGNAAIHFCSRWRHYVRPHSYDPSLILYNTQRYYDLNKITRCCATHMMFSGGIKNSKEWQNICDDFADLFGGEAKFREMITTVQETPYAWLYLNIEEGVAYKNFTQQLYP
tara:strand:- start:610 stop:1350 length:741 start_codon:yes stop_codon:yes gene_type:complete